MSESDKKAAAPAAGELLPVLPLRDIVVFPHMIVPLFVGREKSVRALEAAMLGEKRESWPVREPRTASRRSVAKAAALTA